MNPSVQTPLQPAAVPYSQDRFSQLLPQVFLWLFIGLLLSGIVAFTTAATGFYKIIFSNTLLLWALFILQLGLVVGLSWLSKRIPAPLATLLFLLYSLVTGLTLSIIFIIFQLSSIVLILGVTSLLFALMAAIGYFTKADLTSLGLILLVALVGIIIVSIVNIFLQNSLLNMAISAIGVVIFCGFTAYDLQRLKRVAEKMPPGEETARSAIFFALSLYLDFINLFIDLLSLFGRRR